jgi:hypothetical protein
MMKHFIDWLTAKISPKKASPNPGGTGAQLRQTGSHLRQTGSHLRPAGGPTLRPTPRPKQAVPKRQPEYVDLEPHITGRIEDAGPGKNVLIRNKFVREDTGTHDTLKILDESMLDTEEEEGIDPYNSGQFDRSRNWDKRGK